MFCTNCGKKSEDGMLFCTGCGARLDVADVMPEAPRKSKAPIIALIVLVILLVLAVGAGAVFAYNTFFKKDDVTEDVEEKEEEEDEEEQEVVKVEEPVAEEAVEEPADTTDVSEPAAEETDTAEWCDAYAAYLKELNDKGELEGYPYFGTLYVNDDDIPEIAIMGNCEAAGNRFLTYAGGKVDEIFFGRLGFSFQERKNIIINSDGHSGYYYDTVYEIEENVGWKQIGDGTYSEDYDNMTEDNIPMIYSWDGKEVSESEYRDCFNKFYDASTSLSLDTFEYEYPDYSEMINMLEKREISMPTTSSRYYTDDTAIHRYEFVVDDVTWWQARSACSEKGGYLARINSVEEYNYIVDQIKSEGLEKMVFWLSGEKAYPDYTYRWVNEDYKYEITDLVNDSELSSIWMKGEPSGKGETADGRVVDESYVDLFYLKSEDRFVFNDVPDDLIDAAPTYKGRVAYIIEYE